MESDEVKIERRQQPRVSVQVRVTLSSESNFFTGFTDNISEGGLFVATHDLLPIGQILELEFRLPDADEPICVEAKVRWHRTRESAYDGTPVGFGAQFINIDESDQTFLEKFVAEREPLFFPE